MNIGSFNILLAVMAFIAVIVFVVLYFVKAGYGMFLDKKWGVPISNKLAWIMMEAPVFIIMTLLWYNSSRRWEPVPLLFFIFFQLHYFQRSFIFPFLIKGKNKMPVGIMLMGILFNLINGYMQGEWIFHLSPAGLYTKGWLLSPQFCIGTVLFFSGMIVNIQSDHIIRNLRKPGDSKHYLPEKGLFRYVTSANYFGEIVEWIGFALLTWSLSGVVFAWWTMANLIPRANTIYIKYKEEFGKDALNRKKRVIPFLY